MVLETVQETEKSELEILLKKNADTRKRLTQEEIKRAEELIGNPQYSSEFCWICKIVKREDRISQEDRAIYDTGICQGHAMYVLFTGK